MQCYEGLDESKALYEWKYGKQLLYTQILQGQARRGARRHRDAGTRPLTRLHDFGDLFFSEQFLEPRPLLKALQQPHGAVLLVDEIDKADAGVRGLPARDPVRLPGHASPRSAPSRPMVPPIVLLTSNDTRDLGDAMKRRCLHLHIGFPEPKLEARIIATPRARHARQLCAAARRLRAAAPRARPEEAAVGQRDHRLGARAAAAARRAARPRHWCATR